MSGPRYPTELPGQVEAQLYLRPLVVRVIPSTVAGPPVVSLEGLHLDPDFHPESVDLPEISMDWQDLVDALRAAGAEIR